MHFFERTLIVNGIASYSELFDACRVLFGPDIDLSVDFLHYLHFDGVKAAFRRRAKETHPDLSHIVSSHNQSHNAEHFRRANEAYELLGRFIRNRRVQVRKEGVVNSGSAKSERSRDDGGALYQGTVPTRPLPLGRFLYYQGVIPYRTLLDAVTWQRRSRATIGSIARQWGWLSPSDVETVLAIRHGERFGEKAVRSGLLNAFQVKLLLLHQNSQNRRIGHYFVQHNIVSRQQMEMLVREQLMHNKRYGRR
jgi:curved DNA-binding protein CbpA